MGHYYIWVLTTHSATEAQDTDTAKQIYLNALEISEPYNEENATNEGVGAGYSFDYMTIGGSHDGTIHGNKVGVGTAPEMTVEELNWDESKYSNIEKASDLACRLRGAPDVLPHCLVTPSGQVVPMPDDAWEPRVQYFGGHRPSHIDHGFAKFVKALEDHPDNAVVGMDWHS